MELHKQIKKLRKLLGYTQHDLAKHLNVNQSKISLIETNQLAITLEEQNKIFSFLNASFSDLKFLENLETKTMDYNTKIIELVTSKEVNSKTKNELKNVLDFFLARINTSPESEANYYISRFYLSLTENGSKYALTKEIIEQIVKKTTEHSFTSTTDFRYAAQLFPLYNDKQKQLILNKIMPLNHKELNSRTLEVQRLIAPLYQNITDYYFHKRDIVSARKYNDLMKEYLKSYQSQHYKTISIYFDKLFDLIESTTEQSQKIEDMTTFIEAVKISGAESTAEGLLREFNQVIAGKIQNITYILGDQ